MIVPKTIALPLGYTPILNFTLSIFFYNLKSTSNPSYI
jgi:hypothetical protein